MGELEAAAARGPGAQSPPARARSSEQQQHHAGAGRRRRTVRALSRLARRLLQTLRGARQRRREGAEVEDDEGGFRRPPERDRAQAGGAGGGARLSWGALSPVPAASSGDPRPLTPGAQGLKNHGNTCFLNAVVQCLSHTELLAAFLLLALPDQQGPPGPASGSASGEVTQHLAALVRALWTLEYTPQLSADFKVGRGRGRRQGEGLLLEGAPGAAEREAPGLTLRATCSPPRKRPSAVTPRGRAPKGTSPPARVRTGWQARSLLNSARPSPPPETKLSTLSVRT